jgi:hypothetical protein
VTFQLLCQLEVKKNNCINYSKYKNIRSQSAKTIFGDFPPSSSVVRLTNFAASAPIIFPTCVEPVNATLWTSGCFTIAPPQCGPSPERILITPYNNNHIFTND